MGKVEKLIVLSVLFVVAVILVVSLTMDDPLKKDRITMAGAPPTGALVAEKLSPADAARAQSQSTPAQSQTAAAPEVALAPKTSAPNSLLSANVQSAPATSAAGNDAAPMAKPAASPAALPAASTGIALPAGSILKTTEGLQDSYLPEMKFYTWQAGDNFRTVAFKYYGDYAKLTILRRANEGRQDVQAGEKILVPVYDFDAPGAGAALAAESMQPSSAPATGKGAPAVAAPKSSGQSGGPRTHIVKEGESLWKIAKQELGAGSRWNEIFEANRDVLARPEDVHTGQRLRIP